MHHNTNMVLCLQLVDSTADDRLTDDDREDSDWSDSEVDSQSDQEDSLESEELLTDD